MTTLFCDYSFARPTPAKVRAAGYAGVLRYLSTTPKKNLSATERDSLFSAGLGILLWWETTKTRARTGGTAGGTADGHTASAQAAALGYPTALPIFYAVDENDTWTQVAPYFGAARAAAGYPVRAYGSLGIVTAAYKAGYGLGAQTEAWSGTTVGNGVACLYQRVRPTLSIATATPGVDYDEDVVLAPTLSWWSQPVTPPAPVPAPVTTKGASDMVIVRTQGTGAAYLLVPATAKKIGVYSEAAVLAWGAAGVPTVNLPAQDFQAVTAAFT